MTLSLTRSEVERGTFTPLVFTTTGGMSEECQRYHSRLATGSKETGELRFHYRMDYDSSLICHFEICIGLPARGELLQIYTRLI